MQIQFPDSKRKKLQEEKHMTFSQWLFGGIDNPYKGGQWGILHIMTLVTCAALIIGFYYITKYARKPERAKKAIFYTLLGAIAFFEIMIRFVQCMKLYYFHQPCMDGITLIWIILPKPWCAISCWALIASAFVKKQFFYNYASLSALLCSVIFFIYPGVGYNNEYLLFENWYSILTHALLLTTSITMMVLKITDFKYREYWKLAVGFVLTFVYGLIEIYILKIQTDPLYFMPDGDIQADILHMNYGLYLFCYILLILVYTNIPYLIGDKAAVRQLFKKKQKETAHT